MAQDSMIGWQSTRRVPRLGDTISQAWHGLIKDLFDSYRPERHYMRGPGPKWHEKHPFQIASAGR